MMLGGLLHPDLRVAAFELGLGLLALWVTVTQGWAL